MPLRAPRTTSATPPSIIAVRIVIAVQVIGGYLAAVLFALCGLFGLMLASFGSHSDRNTALALAVLILVVVIVFLVIALARGVAGLRQRRRSDHVTLVTIECGLLTTLLALLVLDGSSWTNAMGGLVAIPVGALITGAAALALLVQPGAWAWTSER